MRNCLSQQTAKGLYGLWFQLPPTHLFTIVWGHVLVENHTQEKKEEISTTSHLGISKIIWYLLCERFSIKNKVFNIFALRKRFCYIQYYFSLISLLLKSILCSFQFDWCYSLFIGFMMILVLKYTLIVFRSNWWCPAGVKSILINKVVVYLRLISYMPDKLVAILFYWWPVYHTRWRFHRTITFIGERQAGKLWIPIFSLWITRLGIKPESTVSVADALSTRPLIVIGSSFRILILCQHSWATGLSYPIWRTRLRKTPNCGAPNFVNFIFYFLNLQTQFILIYSTNFHSLKYRKLLTRRLKFNCVVGAYTTPHLYENISFWPTSRILSSTQVPRDLNIYVITNQS